MQAQRTSRPGIGVRAGRPVAGGFDASFPYEETPDQVAGSGRFKTDFMQRGRWTACCAATWVSARPKLPCGPPSRRSTAATRWPCSSHHCAGRTALSHIRRRMAEFPLRHRPPEPVLFRQEERAILEAWPRDGSISSSARIGSRPAMWSFTTWGLVIIDEEQDSGSRSKSDSDAPLHRGCVDDDGDADSGTLHMV